MTDWWRALTRRERLLIAGGLALVLLLSGYLLVWEPWQQRLQTLRGNVAALRQDLAWMRRAASRLQQIETTAPTGSDAESGVSLATRVDRLARTAGLGEALRRVEPQSDGSLQLWLDDAAFSTLLRWLSELRSHHGIAIGQAEFSRRDGDRVNARLKLSGA